MDRAFSTHKSEILN